MAPLSVLEAVTLAAILSLDAFVASFAYGSKKIKIPILSVQIISVVSAAILGLSSLIGSVVRPYMPEWLTTLVCFAILFVLGVTKLLDSATKTFIRKYSDFTREMHFSMFNLKFILTLYADPEKADVDKSHSISPGEAFSLAIAMSLDGLAVGFGAAVGSINVLAVFIASLVIGTIAVMLGSFIGYRLVRKFRFNLSWLGGVILIYLAFMKLF